MATLLKKTNCFFFLLLFTSFYSCTSDIEFTAYKTLKNSVWESHQKMTFNFEVTDTISSKNLFLNIRNTHQYPFSNLYVITTLKYPDAATVIDTLQYKMTDERGAFLGEGFATILDNKLYYKENIHFSTTGSYQFSVRHAMRKNGQVTPIKQLEGIQDIGFSIEKIK